MVYCFQNEKRYFLIVFLEVIKQSITGAIFLDRKYITVILMEWKHVENSLSKDAIKATIIRNDCGKKSFNPLHRITCID